MGLSKTRGFPGFPPNCAHWMGNMMINHEIMRQHEALPTVGGQFVDKATWGYHHNVRDRRLGRHTPSSRWNLRDRWRSQQSWPGDVLSFPKRGTTSSHACFNVFNFEYHFFLRECLAGASFSLAEIENGKPGISLAMPSDLFVFFHQALRGNREIAGSKSSHLAMIQAPWDRVSTSCLRVHCVTMILRIFTNTHGDKGIHPGDNYKIFNRQCACQCLNMPC